MNKNQLAEAAIEVLRLNNIKKIATIPTQSFQITDNDGNTGHFTIKSYDKKVQFTKADMLIFMDALIVVIEDALRRGEEINIHGFIKLMLKYKAPRVSYHPVTNEAYHVPAYFAPKTVSGKILKDAATYYMNTHKDQYPECFIEEEDDQ